MISNLINGPIDWGKEQISVDKKTQKITLLPINEKNKSLAKIQIKESIHKINDTFKDTLEAKKNLKIPKLEERQIQNLMMNLKSLQNVIDESDKIILENCIKNIQAALKKSVILPDQQKSLNQALLSAINCNDVSKAENLMLKGAEVNQRYKEHNNMTPLDKAVLNASEDMILLLLNHGAEIDAKDDNGYTALYFAVVLGHEELVNLLLDRGATAKTFIQKYTPALRATIEGRSEEVVNRLKERDQGISEWFLKQSLIAHRFGFNLHIKLLNEKETELEGNRPELTYPALIESFTHFYKNSPNAKKVQNAVPGWTQKDWESVAGVLKKAIPNIRNFPGLESDSLLALPCGWKGHATGVVVLGNLFIKANRGNGCDRAPGFHIYEIGNPDLAQREEILKELIANTYDKAGQRYFIKTIHEKDQLDLKPIAYVRHKEQHAGNCPWASAKLVLKAVIYLQLITQHKMTHEDATKNCELLYRAWFNDDRERAVEEIMTDLEQIPTTPHSEEIHQQMAKISEDALTEVLYKCLTGKKSESREKIFYSILEKNPTLSNHKPQFKNPKKETLLQTASRRDLPNCVEALVKAEKRSTESLKARI